MRNRVQRIFVAGACLASAIGFAGCGGADTPAGGAFANGQNIVVFGNANPGTNFGTDGQFGLNMNVLDGDGNVIVASAKEMGVVKQVQIAMSNLLIRQAMAQAGDFSCSFDATFFGGTAPNCTVDETTTVPPLDPGQGIAAAELLDSSGSMSSNDPDGLRKTAAINFLNLIGTSSASNQIAVYDFTTPSGGWAPTAPFADLRTIFDWGLADATNIATASTNINTLVGDFGDTPLYDAMVELCNSMQTDAGGQINDGFFQTILLLSDGQDTASTLTLQDVLNCLAASGIVANVVGLGDFIPTDDLNSIAQQNGGLFAQASDAAALDPIFAAMAGALFDGYTVASMTMDDPSLCPTGVEVTGTVTIPATGASATFTLLCP